MGRTYLFLIGCFMLGMLVGSFVTFVTCDETLESRFCGPEDCPGPDCPCVPAVGCWTIDYTGFGTDETD